MEHSEFVDRYSKGEISVNVDKNQAGFMYGRPGLMPQSLRARQARYRTFAFGGVIVGIALFFLATWWVALAVLFFGLYMFPQAQKSAAAGVLEAALLDASVYKIAKESNVIVIGEVANN